MSRLNLAQVTNKRKIRKTDKQNRVVQKKPSRYKSVGAVWMRNIDLLFYHCSVFLNGYKDYGSFISGCVSTNKISAATGETTNRIVKGYGGAKLVRISSYNSEYGALGFRKTPAAKSSIFLMYFLRHAF